MRTKPLLACVLAAAFALSSCAQPNEPAADSSAPEGAITAEASTEATAAEFDRNYAALVLESAVAEIPVDKEAALIHIGHMYAGELVSSRYALSGKWVEDGMKGSDVAASFDKYYSDNFKAILSDNSWEEMEAMGIKLPFMGLGTTSANGEAIASKKCMDYQGNYHNACTIYRDGLPVGGMFEDTVAFPEENRITFDYAAYIPVRAKGQNGELPEAYLDSVFSLDLKFVPNEGAGPDELPYLIDWTVNKIKSAEAHRLTDDPSLAFH